MKKPNTVMIDGDVLSFKASAAIEERFVVVKHIPSGNERVFDSRTSFYGHHHKKSGGWLAERNQERREQNLAPFSIEEFEIRDDRNVEPLEHSFQICKTMINGILKACDVENYIIAIELEDTNNFRNDVATIHKYKDRPDQIRPLYLKEVKEYLATRHPSVVAKGMEADDLLSIAAAKGEAIQATVDKDAYQVEGWIYDMDKSEHPFEVKDGVGRLWVDGNDKIRAMGFKSICNQLLCGDPTDSCYPRRLCNKRYGEKAAFKLLDPLKTKQECAAAVIQKYKDWYPSPTEYKHWNTQEVMIATWDSVLLEMGRLMYMLRSEDDEGFSIERFSSGNL